MNRIRTMALGAVLVAGIAGVSEAQTSTTRERRPEATIDRGEHGRHHGKARGHRRQKLDLNLTDAQKAQVKAIHERYRPQMKALHERAKPFATAAREARQRGDTAGVRVNRERMAEVMASGKTLREQIHAEVRAVLTPEQRARVEAAGNRWDGGKGMGMRVDREGKMKKRGDKR